VRERFLTLPRAAAVLFFVLFAVTFDNTHVQDDGSIYFAFLRKVFGTHVSAVAYQFGSTVWDAPFYLVSQLVAIRGQLDSYGAGEIGIAAASNAAVVLTLYVGWRILRELDLPRGPAVLLLTLFGTPLFYYGAFDPSLKHAADALYSTSLSWFVLRSAGENPRRRDFVAAGACLALLLATRYANIAYWVGVLGVLALFRLRRQAGWMLASAVVVAAILFAVPIVRHIPYASPPNAYALGATGGDTPTFLVPDAQRLALGPTSIIHPVSRNIRFDPTVPLKMLFTLRRGLFVWTPLTIFAVIGFAMLLARDRRRRTFLLTMAASAVALVGVHAFWATAWGGGNSFSSRFLTSLFPVFLVGVAEFLRRTNRLGTALLALCACFSVWLGFVLFHGYANENENDSVVRLVSTFDSFLGPKVSPYHPKNNVQSFATQVGDEVSARWRIYWGLVS
jgi:hypothetical protein